MRRNVFGLSRLDRDRDGVPCESLCKGEADVTQWLLFYATERL
jgi:hypothetical protein